ncbi:hypothetical protein, partial [Idiomarina sp.]
HSFKSCNTNISVCLLLQVPTQFAWLDSIVKERCFFRSREAYSTLPSRFVNHFLAAFFSPAETKRRCLNPFRITHDNGGEL